MNRYEITSMTGHLSRNMNSSPWPLPLCIHYTIFVRKNPDLSFGLDFFSALVYNRFSAMNIKRAALFGRLF